MSCTSISEYRFTAFSLKAGTEDFAVTKLGVWQ